MALSLSRPTPESQLSNAAFCGDLEQVNTLLENGTDHRLWDASGWTALHWAVVGKHLGVTRRLLEHHSECQAPDLKLCRFPLEQIKSYAQGPLAITLAAELGNVEIFGELLGYLEIPKKGHKSARFNPIWDEGTFDVKARPFSANLWRVTTKEQRCNGLESSVPHATGFGENDIAERKKNASQWKSVLLLCAIRDQQWPAMQMLIKAGADVKFEFALHKAVFRKDPRYVQCLLQHGAEVNCSTFAGRTALHEAVLNGFLDTIIALVDAGADVNICQTKEYWERNQLMDATLRTEGFEYNLTRKGASTLMQACGFLLGRKDKFRKRGRENDTQTPEEKTLEIVRFLLSRGADPKIQDSKGMTVLHYAVLQPHLPLIQLLIDAGATLDALDQDGRIPLHYLARCDEKGVERRVLEEATRLLCGGHANDASTSLLNKPVQRPQLSAEEQSNTTCSSIVSKITREMNRVTSDTEDDENRTPTAIALLSSRWNLVRIFERLGATFPIEIDLQPALESAIGVLEVDIVVRLVKHGIQAPPTSLIVLIRAIIAHNGSKDCIEDDLYMKFKQILVAIIPAGADINFCESDKVEVDSEDNTQKADAEDTSESEEDSSSEEESTSDEDESKPVPDGPKITTPLNLAAGVRRSRIMFKDFLFFGADIYATSSHTFDPILTAALLGEPEDLDYLLKHATFHPSQTHWSRFLTEIPEKSDPIVRVCQCLKRADALNATTAQGRTLLHLAAERGHIHLLTTLISHGAKINILDNQRLIPVQHAGFAQHAAAFEALLMAGETAFTQGEHSSSSHAEFLQNVISKGRIKFGRCEAVIDYADASMLLTLEQHGLDLSSNDIKVPPPFRAAKYGQTGLLSTLVSHNADIEATDEYGWHPIHAACYRGRTEIVQMLIANGADVHCTTRAWNHRDDKPSGLYLGDHWESTTLHLAAMGGHLDIVKILLDLAVDVHADTNYRLLYGPIRAPEPGYGPTALHIVLDTGVHYSRQGETLSEERLQIAQLLVNAGAMVQGVLEKMMDLEDMLKFEKFPKLWAALVEGDTRERDNHKGHDS